MPIATVPNYNIPIHIDPSRRRTPVDIRYSEFVKLLNANCMEKVILSNDGNQLLGMTTEGAGIKIEALPNDPDLLTQLMAHKVDVDVLPADDNVGGLASLARSLILPTVFLAGTILLSRHSWNFPEILGITNPMKFGKSKAHIQLIPDPDVTFDHVAGCDEAKLELAEVVDFLKHPKAYNANGCRIPRGIILDGPPGTGKTLFAKAVSGEAGVPFISCSASEFVEMFVGVGASRVRDIFAHAKKNAPCIVFIDEIDAVGRQRGAGFAGGNDEREQTINQILVEMDGFRGNPNIITIAATNRVDVLDQALLRPGRFDRKITLDLPDFKARTRILGIHSRGKSLEPDIDLETISRRTPSFSGAQLENIMNEAAIAAARLGKCTIGWEEMDRALDRIMVGLRKSGGTAAFSAKQNELVAYHEAGHAVVGALIPDYDQVQKISIIPRSNGVGGLTFFAPQESRLEAGLYSKQYLESQITVALGGRIAEEVIFGEDNTTTGASNDFQKVANIAKRMVKEWGMSDKIGCVAIASPQQGGPFMGRQMGMRQTKWGSRILRDSDAEVQLLVKNCYLKAKHIIESNRPLLDHLANTLIEQEVVSEDEFQMMILQFNVKTSDITIIGEEWKNKTLPFQKFPTIL